ncbi:MAG: FecR domain-containing protein [Spirochaetales bacterium]|nr:FecR domain-containing protein [Spirochaetales bacterium]
MKSIIKSILLILAGALTAGALLYGYSYFIRTAGPADGAESLSFVEIKPGDAVISHISGEVYLIREEKMITPRPGDAVQQGDIIKVVDDSWCQIHFVGKATMNLRSNTLLKIQKLLTSTRDIDVRTELLTGSMIYKVDRLNATDNLEVLAQEKIFRVEGTEFYIEARTDGGSRLSVREGTVAVLSDTENRDQLLDSVSEGETLDLRGWEEGTPLPAVRSLNSGERRIFEEESPAPPTDSREKLAALRIKTEPPGAQLYLDGRLSSSGTLNGLFSADKPLTILARKRGYKDLNMKLIPSEQDGSEIILKLAPLSIEESLKYEADTPAGESIEELKARFESESETLTAGFNRQIRESEAKLKEMEALSSSLQQTIAGLEGNNRTYIAEKRELQEQLDRSLEEQEKLRQLLLQIQELSADQ